LKYGGREAVCVDFSMKGHAGERKGRGAQPPGEQSGAAPDFPVIDALFDLQKR
jgi:hypothetical protein